MMAPMISVVMPAYNHEKYIGPAIESVLNQSYKNFEFIIINDGSSDNTEEIIKTYKDKRIKYFTQENMGAHNAINKGLSSARGEYISIINSDDLYHPDRLAELIKVAELQNAYFIFSDVTFINEHSEEIEKEYEWVNRLKSIYVESHSLQGTFLSGNVAVTTSNFFFLSTILKDIGEFNSQRYAHDYDFVLRVLARYPDKFIYISDKKYLSYRLHGANTIRESINAVHIETLRLLLEMTPEFIENSSDKARVQAVIKYMEHIDESLIADLETKYQQLETKNQQIDDILNTMSWKITAPLRWLYGMYLKRYHSGGAN
jgi:glycosyltransferase involved in cell wall biosynthesis